ncbi:hypothetical protein PBY51_008541 [Eleginops maclovinus]|uniref:Uncharacterized protein n=1 Tax=Eleginops maclovinus TaxID=56733 RepID=A0AAN7WGL9_ELEMC|nr:hypothetical protein PBY51_008541 [Eleginops maclovinus]
MFTKTEQTEENGLILVMAPICLRTVVNISESTPEIRPVNPCPNCSPIINPSILLSDSSSRRSPMLDLT